MPLLTLQLNISCEPIRLISWQDAITLWATGKAEIVEEYEDLPCRSQYISINIPAVVRLTSGYHRRLEGVPLNRKTIFARDAFRCQYCGSRFPTKELTFDHVFPRSRGGLSEFKNVVSACCCCNQRKSDRTPKEAGMPLLRKPAHPRWLPWLLVRSIYLDQIPTQWEKWIGWLENSSALAK